MGVCTSKDEPFHASRSISLSEAPPPTQKIHPVTRTLSQSMHIPHLDLQEVLKLDTIYKTNMTSCVSHEHHSFYDTYEAESKTPSIQITLLPPPVLTPVSSHATSLKSSNMNTQMKHIHINSDTSSAPPSTSPSPIPSPSFRLDRPNSPSQIDTFTQAFDSGVHIRVNPKSLLQSPLWRLRLKTQSNYSHQHKLNADKEDNRTSDASTSRDPLCNLSYPNRTPNFTFPKTALSRRCKSQSAVDFEIGDLKQAKSELELNHLFGGGNSSLTRRYPAKAMDQKNIIESLQNMHQSQEIDDIGIQQIRLHQLEWNIMYPCGTHESKSPYFSICNELKESENTFLWFIPHIDNQLPWMRFRKEKWEETDTNWAESLDKCKTYSSRANGLHSSSPTGTPRSISFMELDVIVGKVIVLSYDVVHKKFAKKEYQKGKKFHLSINKMYCFDVSSRSLAEGGKNLLLMKCYYSYNSFLPYSERQKKINHSGISFFDTHIEFPLSNAIDSDLEFKTNLLALYTIMRQRTENASYLQTFSNAFALLRNEKTPIQRDHVITPQWCEWTIDKPSTLLNTPHSQHREYVL